MKVSGIICWRSIVWSFAAGVSTTLAAFGSASAQTRTDTAGLTAEPVTVVLVETLPSLGAGPHDQFEAVILRRADIGDIILLPTATANGALLDAATRTLILARAHQAKRGDKRGEHRGRKVEEIEIGVQPRPASKAWSDRYIPLAQKVVDRLRTSDEYRNIPGIGQVKTARFYPPRPRPLAKAG